MGVLVVEDEPRIAQSIVACLRQEGFEVETISSFDELEHLVESKSFYPGVIVLDRLLGNVDSLTALKKIRKKAPNSGILILSAINSVNEKANALEIGADDYLSKPFSITELVARVKALDRRTCRPVGTQFIESGNVLIDTITRTVQIDGKKVTFPNREFLVLRLLMQSPGRVFGKFQIFESVWEMNSDSETNVVESTINSLRRRLETGGSTIQVKNMRNVGYWIEA